MICSVTNPISTNNAFQTSLNLNDPSPNITIKDIRSSDLFSTNDRVRLIVELSLFEKIQEESHGGWNKKMTEVIGKTLRVHRITEKGDVRVKLESDPNIRWTIYSYLLSKIEPNFDVGDLVFINKDERVVKHVLGNNWNQNLNKVIAQVGQVVEIRSNGELVVNFNEKNNFSVCAELCYKLTESSENYSGSNNLQDFTKNKIEDSKNIGYENGKILKDIDQPNIVDYFVKKCSSGNLKKVKDILNKYPQLLNEKSYGKTGLQASSYQGHKEIVELLLSLGSKVDMTDGDSDTALHYACFGNQPQIVEILISFNSNLNSVNKNFCSPLHVAVNKLYSGCVRALVNHNCEINIQDSYGDTPSHDIMGKTPSKESIEIFEMLIKRLDLDIYLKNKRGFNLFHQACLKGNHCFTEKLLKKFPDLINSQKTDGYSGLHLAALNGHKKTVECLIKAKADLEMRTNRNQTPLMLAIAKLNSPIIELLVENYANVNSYDEDMDTGLHLVLNEAPLDKNSSPIKMKISDFDKAQKSLVECKIISQVADNLPDKLKENIRLIVALYLIKNGANLYARNRHNFTCLDFVSDDLIKNYLIEYYTSLYFDLNFNRLTLRSSLKTNEIERCKLCDEEPIAVTFLPCKHKCVCFDCSIRIKKCTDCHQCVLQKVDLNGTSLNFSKTELSELLEKVKNLEEAQQCPICMERKKDTTFQCGHTSCNICAKPLINCHICREKIATKIKIYEN